MKFEEDLEILSWNSTTNYFDGNIGQKVNIGQISKIVNFHHIYLKFEEELHIWSFNSTSSFCAWQLGCWVAIILSGRDYTADAMPQQQYTGTHFTDLGRMTG